MDFFKPRKYRNALKSDTSNAPQENPEEPNVSVEEKDKSVNSDSTNTEIEDDDDDFITNEVKKRLKELRKNSFMVLIPEETSMAEEEEEEDEVECGPGSGEWRDVEAEGRQYWSGFDAVYDVYCERMLLFDGSSAQQLMEVGSYVSSLPSPRSLSKKLASPLRCLSLKKFDAQEDENEQLQQPVTDPFHDLETSYVAQVCLTWEALHCQYTLLSQKICSQTENSTSYNHSAQQFQQFQVLLQRFIENEPFEDGSRPEIYARARKALPKLLQVPKIQGCDEKNTEGEVSSDLMVTGPDFIRLVESSILIFLEFIKMDKKKSGGVRNLFGSQNHMNTSVEQIQSCLEKKAIKLKEMLKKKKKKKIGHKKNSWPSTRDDVEMLLGLVDVKVVLRVLRMSKISKEQLFWCEEKMNKVVIADGKLRRDPSPILFPC